MAKTDESYLNELSRLSTRLFDKVTKRSDVREFSHALTDLCLHVKTSDAERHKVTDDLGPVIYSQLPLDGAGEVFLPAPTVVYYVVGDRVQHLTVIRLSLTCGIGVKNGWVVEGLDNIGEFDTVRCCDCYRSYEVALISATPSRSNGNVDT